MPSASPFVNKRGVCNICHKRKTTHRLRICHRCVASIHDRVGRYISGIDSDELGKLLCFVSNRIWARAGAEHRRLLAEYQRKNGKE